MEATVKITNGKKTKFVTEFVAKDSAFMQRFGYWRDGDLKPLANKAPVVDVRETTGQEVDLLASQTEAPTEDTKAQVVEKLKAAGIKFNPNDKKEVLQSLLTEGK